MSWKLREVDVLIEMDCEPCPLTAQALSFLGCHRHHRIIDIDKFVPSNVPADDSHHTYESVSWFLFEHDQRAVATSKAMRVSRGPPQWGFEFSTGLNFLLLLVQPQLTCFYSSTTHLNRVEKVMETLQAM